MTGINLHRNQKLILKKLATTPSARFHELNVPFLESEHMNYHLQKLVDIGLVIKTNGEYALSNFGKDYANLMDDEVVHLEKQPKTSVLLRVVREVEGEIQHLLCRRLKHPYFGKVGRLSGKVQFGETLVEAARRELFEETGLTADNPILEHIYHKLRTDENGRCVQDVLFYRYLIVNPAGTLIETTDVQENFWISASKLTGRDDLDVFEDLKLEDTVHPELLSFTEHRAQERGY
jgi:8-oxo-dGTP diphosphatase